MGDDKIIVVVISSIAGLISGAIGSLIAPWIKWGIEKRRLKLSERKSLINNVREFVSSENYQYSEFMDSVLYTRIKPYLSKGLVFNLEKPIDSIKVMVRTGRKTMIESYQSEILFELTQIERKWQLM
jgi:hypothetical protein